MTDLNKTKEAVKKELDEKLNEIREDFVNSTDSMKKNINMNVVYVGLAVVLGFAVAAILLG